MKQLLCLSNQTCHDFRVARLLFFDWDRHGSPVEHSSGAISS